MTKMTKNDKIVKNDITVKMTHTTKNKKVTKMTQMTKKYKNDKYDIMEKFVKNQDKSNNNLLISRTAKRHARGQISNAEYNIGIYLLTQDPFWRNEVCEGFWNDKNLD